jgi:hypothetical protein
MQRSLKELNNKIAAKWDLDPSKILRPIHSIQNGLDVEMDDDDIQKLREGQDMVLEIEEVAGEPADVKQEWGMAVDPMDDLTEPPANPQVGGYVLRLAF